MHLCSRHRQGGNAHCAFINLSSHSPAHVHVFCASAVISPCQRLNYCAAASKALLSSHYWQSDSLQKPSAFSFMMLRLLFFCFCFFFYHFKALSPAEGLVGLPLGQMVFGSAVGSQLDGLLRGRLGFPLRLDQLLVQQLLIITEVPSCPLVAGVCRCRRGREV